MSTEIFEPCRRVLETYFQDQWANYSPIRWDNVTFTEPSATQWVSFSIKFVQGEPAGLGGAGRRLSRQHGIITVQAFTPRNGGNAAAVKLAEKAASLFRYKTFRDGDITIRTQEPTVKEMGKDVDYFGRIAVINFEADGFF